MNLVSNAASAASAPARRRPRRSATYHRLAIAPRRDASAPGPTVLPTRSSLLRRALRSLGCAV